LVFIRVLSTTIDLFQFVEKIFNALKKDKYKKLRYLLRLIPIQKVCQATNEDLKKNMLSLIQQHLQPNDTFCVRFKKRNNNVLSEKGATIKEIAALIDKDHKADLKNPNLTLIIEVIKSAACLTIIRDAPKWKHFNLAAHQK